MFSPYKYGVPKNSAFSTQEGDIDVSDVPMMIYTFQKVFLSIRIHAI